MSVYKSTNVFWELMRAISANKMAICIPCLNYESGCENVLAYCAEQVYIETTFYKYDFFYKSTSKSK